MSATRATRAARLAALAREHLALLVILATALLLRALLLWQLAHTPYDYVENIDARGYDLWARRVAGGELAPGGRAFYQSPLYAWLLGAQYAIFGAGSWAPFLLQIALGTASVALTYALALRAGASRRAALVAAAAVALYGPIILEEIVIAKTALVVFLPLLALWLLLREHARPLAAGAVLGVAVIGAGQWLPGLLALAAWLLLARARRRAGLRFACGAALVLAPMIAFNSARGGGFMLTSGDAGLNLYMGNNERASGLPGRPAGLRDVPEFEEEDAHRIASQALGGRPLSQAEVSRYFAGRAVDWIAAHPGAFVKNLGRKTLVLLNGYEIPDTYHFAFVRAHFLGALWITITFALLGPPALVGAALLLARARRGDGRALPLLLAAFAYLGALLLFYVRSRYRLPAVPLCAIFAAVAVDEAIRHARARAFRPLAALAAALGAAALLVNHTYCEPPRFGNPSLCLGGDVWFDQEWLKLAEWHGRNHMAEDRLRYLYRATECSAPRAPGQAWDMVGWEEWQAGRLDQAVFAYERAALGTWQPGRSLINLSAVQARRGDTAASLAAAERAATAAPDDDQVLLMAARRLAEHGRCDAVRRALAPLIARQPQHQEAQRLLASCPRE